MDGSFLTLILSLSLPGTPGDTIRLQVMCHGEEPRLGALRGVFERLRPAFRGAAAGAASICAKVGRLRRLGSSPGIVGVMGPRGRQRVIRCAGGGVGSSPGIVGVMGPRGRQRVIRSLRRRWGFRVRRASSAPWVPAGGSASFVKPAVGSGDTREPLAGTHDASSTLCSGHDARFPPMTPTTLQTAPLRVKQQPW